MDLSKKKRIDGLSQEKIEELSLKLTQAEIEVREAYQAMGDAVAFTQLTRLIQEIYQLGHVQGIYEVFGGYVNRSFGAIVEKDGRTHDYFIRKYKMGITDEDIRVEHALIRYAEDHGMKEIAKVYTAPDGNTFFRMDEVMDGKKVSRAFAVYEFLQGEDRYDWINTKMLPEEDESFGELMASFHSCTAGFNPGEKEEAPIIQLLPQLRAKFTHCCNSIPSGNRYRQLWEKEKSFILSCCDEAYDYLSRPEIAEELPECPCHCDFHPGNTKWTGSKCSGLFDLDWSKLDKRLFDVCYASVYIAASWESDDNGRMDLQRILNMVRGYQRRMQQQRSNFISICGAEKKAFPMMMLAGVLYLVNWCTCYAEDMNNLNEFEYQFYLAHTLNALHDVYNRRQELAELLTGI